jgi:hypothetical protein
MKAVMISVEYHDILAATLAHNRHHFSRVLVTTNSPDSKDCEVALANGADVHCTNVFYRRPDGKLDYSTFRKWAALEEGLTVLGRDGWLVIMDADVLWPKSLGCEESPGGMEDCIRFYTGTRTDQGYLDMLCEIGMLIGPLRRMAPWPLPGNTVPAEPAWSSYPLHPQQHEWAGFSLVFHGSDPALGQPPWFDVRWSNCSGGDSEFQSKWPASKRVRPPWQVLHLGEAGENWLGRVVSYADGSLPPESHRRRSALRELKLTRRRTRNFDAEKG